MPLTKFEQETVINFNEGEADAYVFTYNRKWIKHLEQKLGLTAFMNNGFGGKEYKVDKKLIKLPQLKRKVSEATRKRLTKRLQLARETALASKTSTAQVKSKKEKKIV